MKVKTSELIDGPLDWAVATIEKLPRDVLVVVGGRPIVHRTYMGEITELRCEFSAHWAQGGPIIEREKLNLEPFTDINGDQWCVDGAWDSPTPLIAAMRCFVASRLGDEVEVPDELLA
jgi:hypothetical protein